MAKVKTGGRMMGRMYSVGEDVADPELLKAFADRFEPEAPKAEKPAKKAPAKKKAAAKKKS